MRRAALLLGLLVAPAAANPITVRAAAERTEDPEQRRIRAVLEALADQGRAADIARGLTDPEAREWVVRAALPRLHGAGRGAAEKYLVQPDPDAQRDADDHEHDN